MADRADAAPAPDTSGIQSWLAHNPDDPRAGAVRQKLRSMGVTVEDPASSGVLGGIEDYGSAALQGAVLDPAEKVGQMAEHLPDWLGGGLARRAGTALSSIPLVGETMRKGQEAGERHPWVRTAGNILPWLAVPGFGEGRLAGLAADALMGAGGGITQPLDPKDPNYWRDVGLQGLLGGVMGGGLGQVARGAAASKAEEAGRKSAFDAATQAREAAQTKAERIGRFNQQAESRNAALNKKYQEAQAAQRQQIYQEQVARRAAKQASESIPPVETLRWWREALTPIGEQARAPTAVTPEASAQVRRIVGDRLTMVRRQMLLNPNDDRFQGELEHIRSEIESRLGNQAMREQWNNSVFSRFVDQPLQNLQYLSGQEFSDYVSRMGDLAEQYARRAMNAPQAERPELDAISRGLRHVIDTVEQHGTGGDAALTKQLTDAKRAYNLWSIGNGSTSVEKGGLMTPGGIARHWASRQGDAAYGAEMIPGHPQFHPENARLKQQLERARQAHETAPPTPTPQPPILRPGQRQTLPVPKVPPEPKMAPAPTPKKGPIRQLAGHLAHAPATIAGLKVGGQLGHPWIGASIGHAASRAAAPAVKATAAQAGKAPAFVGAATGQEIPTITVRPKPGDRD